MQDPFNFGGAFRGVSTVCGEGRAHGLLLRCVLAPGGLASHQERVQREAGERICAPGGQVRPVSEGLLTIRSLSSCCFFLDVLILEAVSLLGLVASWNLEPLPADNIPAATGIPQALGSNTWRRRVPDTGNPPPPTARTMSLSLPAPGATCPQEPDVQEPRCPLSDVQRGPLSASHVWGVPSRNLPALSRRRLWEQTRLVLAPRAEGSGRDRPGERVNS